MKKKRTLRLTSALLVLLTGFLLQGQKAEPSRIAFRRGASSARVTGSLTGRQDAEYVVNARHNQTLSLLLVSAPVGSVEPSVSGPKNNPISLKRSGGQRWTAALPDDGDYGITVTRIKPQAPATSYDLNVAIH